MSKVIGAILVAVLIIGSIAFLKVESARAAKTSLEDVEKQVEALEARVQTLELQLKGRVIPANH